MKLLRSLLRLAFVLGIVAAGWAFQSPARADGDLILRGGTVYDGTETAPVTADVVIRGERIAAVGRSAPKPGDKVVECKGLIVAPGFIDLHTHSDSGVRTAAARNCLNYLIQGCTSMVTGNCGGGPVAVGKFLDDVDRQGAGCNILHLAPHGSIRSAVMGSARREPTADELKKMSDLVDRAMREGAWGMSTGLIYTPSMYAKTDEIVALAKVVASHGGLYVSHIRGEGATLLTSVQEAIDIGRQAGLPVEISHFKASGVPNWGRIRKAAELIEKARKQGIRVTADQYPYTASSTSLAVTVMPDDKITGPRKDLAKRMAADPELNAKVRKLMTERIKASKRIAIATCKKYPQYVGKSLQEIAAMERTDPVDVVLKLVADGSPQVVNHGISEDDVRWAMQLRWVGTGSDGGVRAIKPDECPHPRNFGTFARKIGRYAIEEGVIPLAWAIRSSSGLPADILGLADRGYLRAGYYADVVVFDPKTYRDHATFEKPQQYSTGVSWVFVAGKAAIAEGKPSQQLYGRALRHRSQEPAKDKTTPAKS